MEAPRPGDPPLLRPLAAPRAQGCARASGSRAVRRRPSRDLRERLAAGARRPHRRAVRTRPRGRRAAGGARALRGTGRRRRGEGADSPRGAAVGPREPARACRVATGRRDPAQQRGDGRGSAARGKEEDPHQAGAVRRGRRARARDRPDGVADRGLRRPSPSLQGARARAALPRAVPRVAARPHRLRSRRGAPPKARPGAGPRVARRVPRPPAAEGGLAGHGLLRRFLAPEPQGGRRVRGVRSRRPRLAGSRIRRGWSRRGRPRPTRRRDSSSCLPPPRQPVSPRPSPAWGSGRGAASRSQPGRTPSPSRWSRSTRAP